MDATMDCVRQVTAPTGIVFSDIQTQAMNKRYLYDGKRSGHAVYLPGFSGFTYDGGYRLVTLTTWSFNPHSFGDDFFRMAEVYGLSPGERVCVVSGGWGRPLATGLAQELNITYPELKTFGNCISVFVVPVGSEIMTDSLKSRVARVRGVLDLLYRVVARGQENRVSGVLWPAYFLDDSSRVRLSRLADRVTSYAAFTDSVFSGAALPNQYLPALAFWVFGTTERRLDFLRYMDERQSYRSAGCRFTLLATDHDSLVGVYLIESEVMDGLDALARQAAKRAGGRYSAVFWPGDYMKTASSAILARLSRRVLSYGDLTLLLEDHELDEYLPALAFWEFGTVEQHPEFMTYMNDGENYVSAGYAFTLLGVNADGTVGAYLIEPARPAP
jgi:hypothetical protein